MSKCLGIDDLRLAALRIAQDFRKQLETHMPTISLD